MVNQVASTDRSEVLPMAPVDLSSRMRELRARQGLKQSEVARRMGLDPSIPSLWEQGRRPVPVNRLQALADALRVSVDELLSGIVDISPEGMSAEELRSAAIEEARLPASNLVPGDFRTPHPEIGQAPRAFDTDVFRAAERGVAQAGGDTGVGESTDAAPPRPVFVAAQRPSLTGWIPEGWEPSSRLRDITPVLPEGYWLDPVRVEKPAAMQLLRSRLCTEDQSVIAGREVPGAAITERIYRHCSKLESFTSNRLPLMEAIFRSVLASDAGGLTVDAVVDAHRDRGGAVPVSHSLLRRVRDSVRPYPLRWVDSEMFG